MLSLQPSPSAPKTTPNLLPTSLKHNGPIPIQARHWTPTTEPDGSRTAYFRGRKLRGRTVQIPAGYEGVVLQKTDKILASDVQPQGQDMAARLRRMEEEDDDDECMDDGVGEKVEVKVTETKMQFDEVVVWGHEAVPEDEDVYVRGMEEWVGFAEAMHSHDTPAK